MGRLFVIVGVIGVFFVLVLFGFFIIVFLEFFDEILFVVSLVVKVGVFFGFEMLLWCVENWVMGLGIIVDYLIFGVGVDCFEVMVYDYLFFWLMVYCYI